MTLAVVAVIRGVVLAGVVVSAAMVSQLPAQEPGTRDPPPPLTKVQRLQIQERAKRLIEEELPDEALRLLERLRPADGQAARPLVLVLRGEAYYAREELVRAVELFEAGLAGAPELRGRVFHLGLAYQKLDRVADAEGVFEALLGEASTVIQAKGAFGLGLNRLLEGKVAAAVELLERSIALDPGAARAHYRLGQLALEQGDGVHAEAKLRQVLKLDSRHHGAAYNLARVLAERADTEGSERWMLRSQELVRARETRTLLRDRMRAAQGQLGPELLRALGSNALTLDRYREAVEWYRRALKHDREDATLLMGLGRATEGAGDVRNAERLYRFLLEREPTFEAARAPLVRLLEKQDRQAEADEVRQP